MTTFRRIKIVATVETAPMLLGEDQIDRTLDELREALKDPGHPRHKELREWLGRVSGRTATFDAERFDLEATNQRLRRGAKEHRRSHEMT